MYFSTMVHEKNALFEAFYHISPQNTEKASNSLKLGTAPNRPKGGTAPNSLAQNRQRQLVVPQSKGNHTNTT